MPVELQHEPSVIEREEQPYVGITAAVTMDTFDIVADRFPEVFAFLGERGVAPAAAPFFRYWTIDMERELVVEAGVPVATSVEGAGDVRPGVLPAGRYATVTHRGHPDELIDVTAALLDWVTANGLEFDMVPSPEGDRWASRLELLLTNPADVPDMNDWVTQLCLKLR